MGAGSGSPAPNYNILYCRRPPEPQYIVKGVHEMKLTPKALPVLACLNMFMIHFNKYYCFPSQARILRYLKEVASLPVSRRQLNRILLDIQGGGLIKRTRRHRREKGRGMVFHSTLYEISIKGYLLLYKLRMVSKARYLEAISRLRSFLLGKKRPEKVFRTSSDLEALGSIIDSFSPALE